MSAETVMDAMHSMESSSWHTPPYILDAAREAIGGDFDLDPCSTAKANENVRAKRFYSLEAGEDGLILPWDGRVWCNPPSPPRPWWELIAKEKWDKSFSCTYLSYSLEPLSQSANWRSVPMLRFPFCVPKIRISYLCTVKDALAAMDRKRLKREKADKGPLTKAELNKIADLLAKDPTDLVKGDQPTHASAVIGVGVDPERMRKAFRDIGEVVIP